MSPASGAKSKDKRAGKGHLKGFSKPSGHVNTNSGSAASGYNPLLGTFQTFETSPVPSGSLNNGNGRFQTIDDLDDHAGNTSGAGVEYDSISNNGSWSGESEDHKERPSQVPPRQETVPGADNDKREKIRQKNEKKHQRQKERRAQELHERCSGYLMSRKLEVLAEQLIAMGFSQERATMALILNEGRVEESVAWLFEGGEEDKHADQTFDSGGSLKIDISEELARMTGMEIRYKASKQEVERVVVSCEGDLEKAEELLKSHKEEPSKPEETSEPPLVVDSKQTTVISQNPIRIQVKSNSSTVIQQRRDEKDINYSKVPVTVGSSVDQGTKTMQAPNKIPSKLDWAKQQLNDVAADKRWASAGSNPSPSFSCASPLQPSPPSGKTKAPCVAVKNELKNLQLGSVKEPVVVMQRPQSVNPKQAPSTSMSSSPPRMDMGWYPNSAEMMKPHVPVPPVTVSRSLSPDGVGNNVMYSQLHYQIQQQQQFVSGNSSMVSLRAMTMGPNLWNRGSASPAVAKASSLGLFSGIRANGSTSLSSQVDWNTDCSLQFDYNNIDWSLDRRLLPLPPNGLSTASNYLIRKNVHGHDSFAYGLGAKTNTRPVLSSNGNDSAMTKVHGGIAVASTDPEAGGSREWTSPFEEKDLFSVPRKFVSSPSL